jgi:AcrR family transcriptional regulator
MMKKLKLINYYYPSKAELFIEMMQEICDEFYRANGSWFEGMEGKSLEEGFKLFIKQMVDYNFNHFELLRIISLNLSLAGKVDETPGYGLLTDIFFSRNLHCQ